MSNDDAGQTQDASNHTKRNAQCGIFAGFVRLFRRIKEQRAGYSANRAKEVGVRKVIGAGRYSLIKQFLAESMFLSLMGILIALPLLFIAMPFLNQITQAEIHLSLFRDYRLWLFLVALVLSTGFLAGSYPAFYLSAFQAIKVIKGNFSNEISAAGIRRSLVVFQFVLSIVLISSIIIIYSQLHYIEHKDLGFDKKQKLIFNFYKEITHLFVCRTIIRLQR